MTTWTGSAGVTDWFGLLHTDPGAPDDQVFSNWSTLPNTPPIFPENGDDAVIGGGFPLTVTNAFGGLQLGNLTIGVACDVTGNDLFLTGNISNSGMLTVNRIDVESTDVQWAGGGTILFTGQYGGNAPHGSPVTFSAFAGGGTTQNITNSDTLEGSFFVTPPNVLFTLVNSGPILAMVTSSGAGGIAFGTNTTIDNHNVIQAVGPGSLVSFSGTTIDNTGGVLNSPEGSLLAAGGTMQFADGTTVIGGTIEANPGSLLTVTGPGTNFDGRTAAIALDGHVVLLNAPLTLKGTVEVGANAASMIDLGSIENASGDLIIQGDGVTIFAGSQVTRPTGGDARSFAVSGTDGTDTLHNNGAIHGGMQIVGLTVANSGTGIINADDTSWGTAIGGPQATTIINDGLVEDTTAPGLFINGNTTFVNHATGTVLATGAGSHIAINTGSSIINDGALEVNGGTLNVLDAVSGGASGHALVTGGGTIAFSGDFQEDTSFAGGFGAGRLDVSQAYAGTVSGFTVNDQIDLGFLALNSSLAEQWQSNGAGGGTLTVQDGVGTSLATLQLAGHYVTADFVISDDGGGHTLVSAVENADTTIRTTLASFALGANDENLIFTDNGPHTGYGNTFDNVMTGGAGDDTLFGGPGNDTLNGADGNDTLVGNDGGQGASLSEHNTLNGGNGNDTIYGQPGDTINGGAGNDALIAENSNSWGTQSAPFDLGATSIETMIASFDDDHIDARSQSTGVIVFAGSGNDVVQGSNFGDFLWGESGNDTLIGGDRDDALIGLDGADILKGGAGNDTIYVDSSDTLIDGGPGTDNLYFTDVAAKGANIDLAADSIEWVESVQSYGLDPITHMPIPGGNDKFDGSGSSADLTVYAGAGDDTVTGGSGNDFLWGQDGNNRLIAGAGNDTLVGGPGADTLVVGTGMDTLYGNSGAGGDGAVDTFEFAPGWAVPPPTGQQSPLDFIYDFQHGDLLDMTALHITFGQLALSDSGGHEQIAFGSNLIVVVGQAGHIDAGDFLF